MEKAEDSGASAEDLRTLLGRGRAKKESSKVIWKKGIGDRTSFGNHIPSAVCGRSNERIGSGLSTGGKERLFILKI